MVTMGLAAYGSQTHGIKYIADMDKVQLSQQNEQEAALHATAVSVGASSGFARVAR